MRVSLSVLRDYVSTLLVEGRVDDAREKFPDIEEEDWQQLVAQQPAGSNNKYLMWSANQVDEGFSVEVVVQVIRLFDGHVQRLKQKDINQYKDVGAIEKAVDELGEKKTKSQEAKQAKADTDVIYNDDDWLVVRPHTSEASCKYGVGTRWCIAATASRNYFGSYSESNNKFYFVIDKKQLESKSPSSKFALAIIAAGQSATGDRIQVYDASDKLVSMQTVASHVGGKWPEIWRKIEAHVAANPITREVEEAQKAVEEHVQALLKGEKVGQTALEKIAQKGKLTAPVVKALLSKFPKESHAQAGNIMSSLADRSDQMPPESAMLVMKWIASTRPEGGGHWSGNWYLERMMKNANLTPEGFGELASTGDETILSQIFTNPACPDEVKSLIASKVKDFKREESARAVYWELIRSGKITSEQFKEAMKKDAEGRGYRYLINQILSNAETLDLKPEMIRQVPVTDAYQFKNLMKLKNLPGDYAAKVLAKMMAERQLKKYDAYQILKTIPLDVASLEQMWSDNKSPELRTSLLQNPAIGAGNAGKFAKSKNSAYRFAIAHNTVTPEADLAHLAKDDSVSTRSAVAANSNTPAASLVVLARDEAVAVRASVASNAKATRALLDVLRKDTDDFVRKAARKTLKTLEAPAPATEALSMRSNLLILEALDDDETPDIMNPSWRDLPARSVEPTEFIAVFLLQNNGSADREEISDAYQDWMGTAGSKELWKTNKYSEEIFRGITAGGKGWFWSPPGINKGALFRLTPAGASAALEVLNRHRGHGQQPSASVSSAQAKAGKTYWTPNNHEALNITGYESGELSVEELETNGQGQPIRRDGKVQKLNPDRSRRARWRGNQGAKFFKYESPAGETKYVQTFPKVNLPANSKVTFVKNMYGLAAEQSHRREANLAIVKHGEQFLLIPFPLWAQQHGATPAEKEKNVPPPVRKSPPAPADGGAAREPGAPRGPKVSYKIYGRKAGKPAHTRLKGQAFGAPNDTQFAPGELASLQGTDDGKLKVKKLQGDHEQTWDPVEG